MEDTVYSQSMAVKQASKSSGRKFEGPSQQQLQSPLLRTPIELQREIYSHVLVSSYHLCREADLEDRSKRSVLLMEGEDDMSDAISSDGKTIKHIPSTTILHTCQAIYKEGLPILYHQNIFHNPVKPKKRGNLTEVTQMISLDLMHHMKHVSFDVYTGTRHSPNMDEITAECITRISESCSALRTLHVHIPMVRRRSHPRHPGHKAPSPKSFMITAKALQKLITRGSKKKRRSQLKQISITSFGMEDWLQPLRNAVTPKNNNTWKITQGGRNLVKTSEQKVEELGLKVMETIIPPWPCVSMPGDLLMLMRFTNFCWLAADSRLSKALGLDPPDTLLEGVLTWTLDCGCGVAGGRDGGAAV